MLWTIVRKEILENLSSPKFVFTFALCTVIILLAVFTGIRNYQADLREHEAAVALNKEDMEKQQQVYSIKIYKPPQVLSPIIIGVQQVLGRTGDVHVYGEPVASESKHGANPLLAIFGELDLTFIIKIVLSLFAILFTFDLIVGEKERGTLRMMLANKVPRDRIILGKAIGNFISLLIPMLIPLLLAVILLLASPGITLRGEDWGRVGLIFFLFFIYLSVFFSLGLFVSTRTNRSSSSLLILLFLWVVGVTVIPKAAIMVAGQMSPIPSAHEVSIQKYAFMRELYQEYPKIMSEYMKKNPQPSTKGMSKDETQKIREAWSAKHREFSEAWQKERQEKIDAFNESLNEDFEIKQNKQRILATNLARVSPASSLTFGAMSLGRTGLDEHENFLNSIKAYMPQFALWVNKNRPRNNVWPPPERPKPDLSTMPVHTYTPENVSTSFRRAMPDFIIMALMVVVFFAGAFVSFLKYDVR